MFYAIYDPEENRLHRDLFETLQDAKDFAGEVCFEDECPYEIIECKPIILVTSPAELCTFTPVE